MKSKRIIKQMITSLMIMAMMLMNVSNAAPYFANAVSSTKKLASSYLNATEKYLHLGNKTTGTFDFNIKKSAQKKGAKYTWYIKEDKGNPNAVTIDKKTGVVTAKEAGVAYIRCKITLADGTVLRPEAKVTVRNNITDVSISNLPKDMTLTAGEEKDFNRKILNTEGGKGKKSDGITRWEIADDSADVVSANDKGVVFPTKEGEFKIRAVSFQSKAKYNLWLKDKELNAKYITAASEWHTIKVEKSDGKATVSSQENLDKALASDEFDEINLITKKEEKFIIKEVKYSDKVLTVDAPNSDMENYGAFKQIIVKGIKDNTWIEYADGNIVYLSDTELSFVIDSGAEVKQIVIDTPNSIVNLEINGKVDQIVVTQPSQVNLTGSSKDIPVTVEETAEASRITASVSMDLLLNANADIVLEQGSEDTQIDKSDKSVVVNVENKSSKSVVVTTNKQGGETIEAGGKGTSDETTATSPTPAPSTGGGGSYTPPKKVKVTGVTVEPTTMELFVGEEVKKITATVLPPNASNKNVTWSSSDTTVATVDNKGNVTPISVGEAVITVTTEDGNKTATTLVVVKGRIAITNLIIMGPTKVGFDCNVAGATIKWDGTELGETIVGNNVITVPLMESGQNYQLSIEHLGYLPYQNDAVIWSDPFEYKVSDLSEWIKDRTEPKEWSISDGWITYSTDTAPANNWYAWHGKKATTDNAITDSWKVETEFVLTNDLLSRNGVRTSMWLHVLDEHGESADWSILQFKIDEATQTRGWQYWDSSDSGKWIDIVKDLPTTEGIYKLAIHYNDGNVIGYINGMEVFSYPISESRLTSVKEVIFNSYSFGESYEVKWKVPTVSYVERYALGTKFIANSNDLASAIANQKDGETWILKAGTYDLDETQLAKYATWKNSGTSPQAGWYFPLYSNNLQLIGEGEVVLTSTHVTANGAWATQNFITVFGNNITLKNLTIKPKLDTNKAIEVIGQNVTLEDIEIKCNDLVSYEKYLSDKKIVAGSDKDYWEFYCNGFGGSIIINTDDFGTATLKNVLITKAWFSPNYSNAGTLDVDCLVIDYRDAAYAPYADYGLISGPKHGINYNISGNGILIKVDNTLADLQKQVLDRAPSGTTVELAAGTYYISERLLVPVGVILDTDTNNANIEVLAPGTVYVKNVREFTEALNNEAATIRMAAGTYRFDSHIRIDRAVTIIGEGDATVITKGDKDWTNNTGSKGYASLITIRSGDNPVKLENIKLTGAANVPMTGSGSGTDYGHGINVVSSSDVTLVNVTSTNNEGAGLIVNSSNVVAENLKTSGNGWYGVNVDQADSGPATFELVSGELLEDVQIVSDKTEGASVDLPGEYVEYKFEGTKTIWSNKGLQNAISIVKEDGIIYYPTIQAAIDSAKPGHNIIKVGPGNFGTDPIKIVQKEDVNITLEAVGEVVLKNQILIDGGGRYNGNDTLTIKGFTFDFSTVSDTEIIITAQIEAPKYVYAHNVSIEGCKFIGDSNKTVVAVKAAASGGHSNFKIINCIGQSLHSLAQLTSVAGLTVKDCSVSGGESGVNLQNSTDIIIVNLTVDGTKYGVRAGAGQDSGTNESRMIISNSYLKADQPLVLRNGAPSTIDISGSKLMNDGDYAIYSLVKDNGEGITLILNDNDWGELGYQSHLIFGLDNAIIEGNDVSNAIIELEITDNVVEEIKDPINEQVDEEVEDAIEEIEEPINEQEDEEVEDTVEEMEEPINEQEDEEVEDAVEEMEGPTDELEDEEEEDAVEETEDPFIEQDLDDANDAVEETEVPVNEEEDVA